MTQELRFAIVTSGLNQVKNKQKGWPLTHPSSWRTLLSSPSVAFLFGFLLLKCWCWLTQEMQNQKADAAEGATYPKWRPSTASEVPVWMLFVPLPFGVFFIPCHASCLGLIRLKTRTEYPDQVGPLTKGFNIALSLLETCKETLM